MPASARIYSSLDVPRGPVDIWIGVAKPADGAELVIDVTNGIATPDSTSNPNAQHLGMSKGGASVLLRQPTEGEFSDELPAKFRDVVSADEAVISPKGALQIQNLALLQKLITGATLSTPTGKTKLTGGGLTTVTYYTILALWMQPESTTRYFYVLLYKARNNAGLAFDLTSKASGSSDLAFEGVADLTRLPGDNLYQIVNKS